MEQNLKNHGREKNILRFFLYSPYLIQLLFNLKYTSEHNYFVTAAWIASARCGTVLELNPAMLIRLQWFSKPMNEWISFKNPNYCDFMAIRHNDLPIRCQVNVIFLCHEGNLILVQPSECKHSNLFDNMAPISRCTYRGERDMYDAITLHDESKLTNLLRTKYTYIPRDFSAS